MKKRILLIIVLIIVLMSFISCDNKQGELDKNINLENNIDSVYYQKGDIDSDTNYTNDVMKALIEKSGINNRTVTLVNSGASGNKIVLIYSMEKIKNVRLYTVDMDILQSLGWNISKFIEREIEECDYLEIKKVVRNNEAIAIRCNEPEGVPGNIISWKNKDGKLSYLVVRYDG